MSVEREVWNVGGGEVVVMWREEVVVTWREEIKDGRYGRIVVLGYCIDKYRLQRRRVSDNDVVVSCI